MQSSRDLYAFKMQPDILSTFAPHCNTLDACRSCINAFTNPRKKYPGMNIFCSLRRLGTHNAICVFLHTARFTAGCCRRDIVGNNKQIKKSRSEVSSCACKHVIFFLVSFFFFSSFEAGEVKHCSKALTRLSQSANAVLLKRGGKRHFNMRFCSC